jgi:hypothetical protein
MPRRPREATGGLVYHVLNRGVGPATGPGAARRSGTPGHPLGCSSRRSGHRPFRWTGEGTSRSLRIRRRKRPSDSPLPGRGPWAMMSGSNRPPPNSGWATRFARTADPGRRERYDKRVDAATENDSQPFPPPDPTDNDVQASGRYYNPICGTWGQEDRLEYVDGANPYRSMRSSPLRFSDTDGNSSEEQR